MRPSGPSGEVHCNVSRMTVPEPIGENSCVCESDVNAPLIISSAKTDGGSMRTILA